MGAMVMDGTRPQADRAACISCLCCLEVCPEDAIAVQRSALARLIH
jgi:Fe-S-cluster-containing hydrogenase component 2